MIKVNNLVKTYTVKNTEVKALKGVSLEIEKGEIFGVIGLSGAGKSSLVRCISSIEKPTSGEIIINGSDIAKLNEKELRAARQKIGLVFQHFNLMLNRTVYENIAFPLEIAGIDKKYIHQRTLELLEVVGLSDKKNSFPGNLSGGQKQRVGIARALANNPDILICDEATSALDPATTTSILNLLQDINDKLKITILIITHEMDVIKTICDKVAILENGKIIESDTVINVFVQPKTETAKKFFQDANLELSNNIYKNILEKNSTIVKVNFIGNTSIEPYISNAIKKFDVDIAILAGNIQEVSNTIIGTLIIELIGDKTKANNTLDYFKQEGLLLEVLRQND